MVEKLTNRQLNENSLEVLLEDFTKRNSRKKTAPKTEINYKLSLKERAIRGMELLAKQEPCTLSQMRAQALIVKMFSGEYIGQKLDETIKYDLRMYFPEFSKKQIDNVIIKLYSILC